MQLQQSRSKERAPRIKRNCTVSPTLTWFSLRSNTRMPLSFNHWYRFWRCKPAFRGGVFDAQRSFKTNWTIWKWTKVWWHRSPIVLRLTNDLFLGTSIYIPAKTYSNPNYKHRRCAQKRVAISGGLKPQRNTLNHKIQFSVAPPQFRLPEIEKTAPSLYYKCIAPFHVARALWRRNATRSYYYYDIAGAWGHTKYAERRQKIKK